MRFHAKAQKPQGRVSRKGAKIAKVAKKVLVNLSIVNYPSSGGSAWLVQAFRKGQLDAILQEDSLRFLCALAPLRELFSPEEGR
jgi:hypothetical protein